jgi:hypothetical protein
MRVLFGEPATRASSLLLCAVIAITSITMTLPARATELPNYSVEQWCEEVARSAGARSEVLYGGCIDQEQSAYDHLKQSWADVPVQTRTWCDEVARSAGPGSYMLLNGCVDQENSARQQNSTRRFQR